MEKRNNVEYFVNEEKGVVVCKITNVRAALTHEADRKGIVLSKCDICQYVMPMSNAFIGKAKCSSDDTFDLEKGKRIAYRRAVLKLNRAKAHAIDRIIKAEESEHEEIMKGLTSLLQKYSKTAENMQDELDDLSKLL